MQRTRFIEGAPSGGGGEKELLGPALTALGVVFGDIGTSPIYAYETALGQPGAAGNATGVASLVIWTVFLVVSVKYALVVMRADYHGEGGIFALVALLRERWSAAAKGGARALPRPVVWLGIAGAAMLLGDGAITPAVSVLSAVEGFAAVRPELAPFSTHTAFAILCVLFFVQRFGTGGLGAIFGPVMLVWFLALGSLGISALLHAPEALLALNPLCALELLHSAGWRAWPVIGAAVLAITGAEALYADLGHFGRPPILRAWRWIVFPALVLNYLGQAAVVLREPSLADNANLFFHLAQPGFARLAFVVLATIATIIASQALISAVFSLTSQAMDLGFLPRLQVLHTSHRHRGQIYVPVVNFLLGAVCLLLVVAFRTSEALASAYGIAVTAAMVATSIVFCIALAASGRIPRPAVFGICSALLLLDVPLFLSTLGKFFEGGFVPVVLALFLGALMISWIRGRELVRAAMRFGSISIEALAARMDSGEIARSAGTEVFVVRRPIPEHAIACILEQVRRLNILAERVVILLLDPDWADPREACGEVKVARHPGGLWVFRGRHGYMARPDVPGFLSKAGDGGDFAHFPESTFYVIAREFIVSCPRSLFPTWQRRLFGFMARNVLPSPEALRIPSDRLIVYTWLLRMPAPGAEPGNPCPKNPA